MNWKMSLEKMGKQLEGQRSAARSTCREFVGKFEGGWKDVVEQDGAFVATDVPKELTQFLEDAAAMDVDICATSEIGLMESVRLVYRCGEDTKALVEALGKLGETGGDWLLEKHAWLNRQRERMPGDDKTTVTLFWVNKDLPPKPEEAAFKSCFDLVRNPPVRKSRQPHVAPLQRAAKPLNEPVETNV